MTRKRIDFIFFDAGGGHRSAATALKLVIEREKRPWEIRLVNLQEVLDPLDIFRKLTGLRLQDFYNELLKRGWTLGATPMMRVMQRLIRWYHPQEVRLLARLWQESRPDLVVSLVPHFNRALRESLPATPFVTILTDLADYPPHMWIERQEQYFICGTERAVEQALALGHPKERVFLTSGMILHPRFYEAVGQVSEGRSGTCSTDRRKLGLDPELPAGLVLFGGQGSGAMGQILERLDRSKLDLQLILICGRNEKLTRRLRAYRSRIPKFVEGFTSEVPFYMHLADFFIGKPGPGSVSEALAMGLAVITSSNAWTLPQERYNAEWVRSREAGLVVRSFREIERAVGELIRPGNFERFRKNAAAIRNRAVFEIPEMLGKILSKKGLGDGD
jgi:1,2-diacylglycerol 3-beta-galactosyltransferase